VRKTKRFVREGTSTGEREKTMTKRFMWRHRIGFGVAASALAVALIGVPGRADIAAAATHSAPVAAHTITPLPNCAVTFVPKVNTGSGRVCLQTTTALARTARAKGLSVVTDSVVRPAHSEMARPNSAIPGCFFDFYQNGPYAARGTGWGYCVSEVQSNGDFYVPKAYNDQASSWNSCTDGVFYANQPGTLPSQYFPIALNGANFPWGSVQNDSLSSAVVYYGDTVC
jgi:hypothetical protein